MSDLIQILKSKTVVATEEDKNVAKGTKEIHHYVHYKGWKRT